MLSRWVIDVNFKGGVLTQDMTFQDVSANFVNPLSNANYGKVKFTNGTSFGGDVQAGYFFGRSAHFGVGLGLMYLAQQGDATLDAYRVEYQSADAKGQTFRQVVTANAPVKEQLKITNVNIPLVLKYKNRFSKHWGFTADAGILYNVKMSNAYKTNGSFDYEAIYQLVGPLNNQVSVYDYNITPANTDLMITKAAYLNTHPESNVQNYFNQQRDLGYNVGLGVNAANKSGTVSYVNGSIGFLLQPSINYFFSDKVALNVGGYFMYQSFTHNDNTKKLTNKVGEYNSVLNGLTSTNNQSYGGNIGLRFFFGKPKDTDGDGIPDKKDLCPNAAGLPQFQGCPDRDGDGIMDSQDSCIDIPGLVRFHGCPDSDNDGTPDKDDACPYNAGSPKTHGCPDTDLDGIPDNEDRCPTVAGPASNNGCPIDTVKPAPPAPPRPKPAHDMSEPIMFELGKAKVREESLPILVQAVFEMNSDDKAFVVIDGHTDVVGSNAVNDALSFKRAYAVKKYLTDMGGNPKRMISVGHGSRQPLAPNDNAENRARNRRVIMSLKRN